MVLYCPELCMIKNSSIIHTLCAKSIINDYESHSSCYSLNLPYHKAIKSEFKKKIIKNSIKYQIACKYTSFIAIEERDHTKETNYSISSDLLSKIYNNLTKPNSNDPIPEISFDSCEMENNNEFDFSFLDFSSLSLQDDFSSFDANCPMDGTEIPLLTDVKRKPCKKTEI